MVNNLFFLKIRANSSSTAFYTVTDLLLHNKSHIKNGPSFCSLQTEAGRR